MELILENLVQGVSIKPHTFYIRGARIIGRLALDEVTTEAGLTFDTCHFTEGFSGRDMSVSRLSLINSIVESNGTSQHSALDLAGANVAKGFDLQRTSAYNENGSAFNAAGSTFQGEVNLRQFVARGAGQAGAVEMAYTRFSRSFILSGATIVNESGPALQCVRIEVAGDVLMDRNFVASGASPQGSLCLASAVIAGDLRLSSATILNDSGPAVHADGMKVLKNLKLDLRFRADGEGDEGALRIAGAEVLGQIDMSNATIKNSSGSGLVADGLVARSGVFLDGTFNATGNGPRGTVMLKGAQISGTFNMSGATLINRTGPALVADGLTLDADAFFDNDFSAQSSFDSGCVRLNNARIVGPFVVSGLMENDCGPALNSDGISVHNGIILQDKFSAIGVGETGAIRMVGADVGSQLVFREGEITNLSGPALVADSMTIGGSLILAEVHVTSSGPDGAVRIAGSSIAGQVDLDSVHIVSTAGPALMAEGLSATKDAIFSGHFEVRKTWGNGALVLDGAKIDGSLVLSSARVSISEGVAFSGVGMQVRASAYLNGSFASSSGGNSTIDVQNCKIGGSLTLNGSEGPSTWKLDGLTYGGYPSIGFSKWLGILTQSTLEYRPQPYQQLAAAARAAGHDGDARRALIAQRNDQVTRGTLSRREKGWARFTGITLGYGYEPWRALIGVFLIFLLACLACLMPGALAQSVANPNPLAPTAAISCRVSEILQVAVNMSVPLVSSSSSIDCAATATPQGGLLSIAAVILNAAGWAFTALFAAGFTSAVRRP